MDADEVLTCPVCKRSFRYYAGVWLIGHSTPYCCMACAKVSDEPDHFDGEAAP